MLFPVKNNLDIGILEDFSDSIPVSGDNLFSTNLTKKLLSFLSFISFPYVLFLSINSVPCPGGGCEVTKAKVVGKSESQVCSL